MAAISNYGQMVDRDRAAGRELSKETRLAVGEFMVRNRPSRALVGKMAQRLKLSMENLWAMRNEYVAAPQDGPARPPTTSAPRPAKKIAWNGRSLTAKEWAAELGVNVFTIYDRASRRRALDGSDQHRGVATVKAAAVKKARRGGPMPRQIRWNGRSMTAEEWSKTLGTHISTVRERARELLPLDGSIKKTNPKKVAAAAVARAALAAKMKEKKAMTKVKTATKLPGARTFEGAQAELEAAVGILSALSEHPTDRARRILRIVESYVTTAEKADVVAKAPAETVTSFGPSSS